MSGFDVGLSGEVGSEHREVVGDDRVKFVILPKFSDLFVVSH
jgi:hypothetical protein